MARCGIAPTAAIGRRESGGIAVTAGYLIGLLRGWSKTRHLLAELGLPCESEATMIERTVFRMPATVW